MPSLEDWRHNAPAFFFTDKTGISLPKNPTEALKQRAEAILQGKLAFFSHDTVDLGPNYDWLTNPDTGYRYDAALHWTAINDFSQEAGDIKFVWEKSRFSHVLPVIRYDYHSGKNCAEWVFLEIDSWIAANPLNHGPNYKCSQEISLRVLHWVFVLYYYREAPELTTARFARMLTSIRGQMDHVYKNIDFSRIAVRNNHAITETLALYLIGLLMPFMPHAARWKKDGKKWLEEEVAYQVYDDGTFIQFSHNYHRVLIQLLTWAVHLADANQEEFSPLFYEKTEKTLWYLYQCQMLENGYLPNYGANDGALFFQLSDSEFRDYRPQMNALYHYFTGEVWYETDNGEDFLWYSQYTPSRPKKRMSRERPAFSAFPNGGIYLMREAETLTFIKCAAYRDRPSQADNLHVDIWHKGRNILMDTGTYKYNTDEANVRYFFGTEGHNTVMVDQQDQMKKGPRFIWWNWTKAAQGRIKETESHIVFTGHIRAFEQIGPDIRHNRTIRKAKSHPIWEIEDTIVRAQGHTLRQIWHVLPGCEKSIQWHSSGNRQEKTGAFSEFYGHKKEALQLEFCSTEPKITTVIQLLQ